jgi:hypothetical protein
VREWNAEREERRVRRGPAAPAAALVPTREPARKRRSYAAAIEATVLAYADTADAEPSDELIDVELVARPASRLPGLFAFVAPVLIVAGLLVWFSGLILGPTAPPAARPAGLPAVQLPAGAQPAAEQPAAEPPAAGLPAGGRPDGGRPTAEPMPSPVFAATGAEAAARSLSPIFTPEVRFWEPQIREWAAAYALDPNLVATVMQIESCGNPGAVSGSGAQGLFQVMPFHFGAGEEMQDPQTNAVRGLNFLTEMLKQSGGHVGMALVGYNGGYRAVQGSWETWPSETRRYYRWGAGLYSDAATGLGDSPTLHDWLTAGGESLCSQARAELELRSAGP